jgi:hypothetical protein
MEIETLGKTFRKQASGMRLLADEILDGEFRRGLLVLARDYDLRGFSDWGRCSQATFSFIGLVGRLWV